jgi:hypothetical protein
MTCALYLSAYLHNGQVQTRVLRRISEQKKEELTGGWRKIHNKELRSLYSLPNIIMIIKVRKMIWARHVAHIRGTEMCAKF